MGLLANFVSYGGLVLVCSFVLSFGLVCLLYVVCGFECLSWVGVFG